MRAIKFALAIVALVTVLALTAGAAWPRHGSIRQRRQ